MALTVCPPATTTVTAQPNAATSHGRHGRSSVVQPRPGRDTWSVSETVDNLILDLLEWIGPGDRPYAETIEAWRTSCPRLPVWEDAIDLGFIERHREPPGVALVSVTAAGRRHLMAHRKVSAS